ncbi:4Fe-4S binding protein [Luteolibacter algae]|uniref:4Fe-4S binding protein n=1 Tax=Luteolibacter algae TaxID=454151 RepID=A0ABW5D9F4_9BACT
MSCADLSKSHQTKTDAGRRLRRYVIGAYRVALIGAAMWCLWFGSRNGGNTSPDQLLDLASETLSSATSIGEAEDGFFAILNESGETVGWAGTTFPEARNIQGYSGPSELFIILDAERKVLAVRFLKSADTSGHVEKIKQSASFWEQWTGKSESWLAGNPEPHIVSGATLTSEAMARGVAAKFGAKGLDEWFPDPVKLSDLSKLYPEADELMATDREGIIEVRSKGKSVGTVLRSSRMGVKVRGFNSTSDVIAALSSDSRTVLAVILLASRDNDPYVRYVQEELVYANDFKDRSVASILQKESETFIVSGASITAEAVILTVQEMLQIFRMPPPKTPFPWMTALALGWMSFGVILGLGKWGNSARWRIGFAVVSVIAGLGLGWMVSQAQLIGWGSHGLSTHLALPLIVLTAIAMLVPAFFGKNVYCSRICPHGAAQTILGKITKKRFALPARAHKLLQKLPWITLVAIWSIAFIGWKFAFAMVEPFEIWSSGFYSFLPAFILVTGLVASVFLPQAYCHYGCPTGAMLKFLTHSPSSWTRRDSVATVLICAAWVLRFL